MIDHWSNQNILKSKQCSFTDLLHEIYKKSELKMAHVISDSLASMDRGSESGSQAKIWEKGQAKVKIIIPHPVVF